MDDSIIERGDNATLLGLLVTDLLLLDGAWEGNLSIAEREYKTHFCYLIAAELRRRDQQQSLDLFGLPRSSAE